MTSTTIAETCLTNRTHASVRVRKLWSTKIRRQSADPKKILLICVGKQTGPQCAHLWNADARSVCGSSLPERNTATIVAGEVARLAAAVLRLFVHVVATVVTRVAEPVGRNAAIVARTQPVAGLAWIFAPILPC